MRGGLCERVGQRGERVGGRETRDGGVGQGGKVAAERGKHALTLGVDLLVEGPVEELALLRDEREASLQSHVEE